MPLSITLPNIRKLFRADPGYVMFEADLKGADAQVVAWEAEDEDLKSAFRAGVDVHAKNAEDMWGTAYTRLPEHSHERRTKRQECKKAIHALNYGSSTRTVAISNSWTVREADSFAAKWFSLHPGIRRWHERVKSQLARDRTIRTAFGFRRVFFDRLDGCFTEALAWIPQTTVALNTYQGAFQLERRYWPEQCEAGWTATLDGILLQTHDSLNFQFPSSQIPPPKEIRQTLLVHTPYADPLYIPWDLKKSDKSWGEMTACE